MTITGDSQKILHAISGWLLTNSKTPTLLLVSGGSAGKVFAKVWRSLPQEVLQNYTISLVDERYGPVGHPDSNWKLLQDLGVVLNDANSIPVLNGLGFEQTASEWGTMLQETMRRANKTIAIFGIGEDSHIAGIKPNSPATHSQQGLTCAYSWDDYERITVTPQIFPLIDSAIVYTQGSTKYPALELLESNLDPIAYPSQHIKLTREYTLYYQPA